MLWLPQAQEGLGFCDAANREGGSSKSIHHKESGLASIHKARPDSVDTTGGTAPPVGIGPQASVGSIPATKAGG